MYGCAMAKRGGKVHVTTHRRHYVNKDGVERDYTTCCAGYYRADGKVRNETVANLSHLPDDLIEVIRRSLNGGIPARRRYGHDHRLRPHGHVAAVMAIAKTLGLPKLLGPPGRSGPGVGVDHRPGGTRARNWPRHAGGPTPPWPAT